MKTKNIIKSINFFAFIFLTASEILLGCTSPSPFPIPKTKHTVEFKHSWSEIWEQTVYSVQNEEMSSLGVASGEVCFEGSLTNDDNYGIYCLESISGKLLWNEKVVDISCFLVSADAVYVARSGGFTGVGKFDLKEGSLIWYQPIKGSGISHLAFWNDELQVLTVPHGLLGLDITTGEIIQKYSDNDHVFLSTSTELFILQSKFTVVTRHTGKTLWATALGKTVWQAPVILKNSILVRTGWTGGRVYNINRKTGDIFWRTKDDIISNIAYSKKQQAIYLLDKDGRLLKIDINTGRQEVSMQFTPSPFILNGESVVGGYELAYDDNLNMLFVLLGDSRQMFAFQEN